MNQLKEAEKKASTLVQDARKGFEVLKIKDSIKYMYIARVDRMKEAKIEAEQIIAAYRAEMEAVYQRSLAVVI
jgi:hypothetical protein